MAFSGSGKITLARDLGVDLREENLPRELLYIPDEAFSVYPGEPARVAGPAASAQTSR